MSFVLKTVSASVKNLYRGRALIGRVTLFKEQWLGRCTLDEETFTAKGVSAEDVFHELVKQMNRVALGVDRHDHDGAMRAREKQNQRVLDDAARFNRDMQALWGASGRSVSTQAPRMVVRKRRGALI